MDPNTPLIKNFEENRNPGLDKADFPHVCDGCGREMTPYTFDNRPSWGPEWVDLGPLWLCDNYRCLDTRNRTINEARARRDQEHPHAVLQMAGVPKHFLGCSFETFRGYDKAVRSLKNHDIMSQDLFLHGNAGAGKTHLSVALLRELVGKGFYNFRFVSLAQLISTLARVAFEHSEEGDSETESEILAQYIDAGVLVLDDIGQHGCSKWVRGKLYLIIDSRYAEDRPTITSSNLSLEEIKASLGNPIASRLSASTIIHLTMPDHRRRRANSK